MVVLDQLSVVFGDLSQLIELQQGRLCVQIVDDIVRESEDAFENLDELREVIEEVRFLFLYVHGQGLFVHKAPL